MRAISVNTLFAMIMLPLALLATGVVMALTRDDPAWLLVGAILAIATGYLARRNNGS